jgi:hypothetical protein
VIASLRRFARGISSLVLRVLLVLVVIEGTASWLGFALGLSEGLRPPEPERLHMRYDADLGWAHVPDTRLEDFYGPGRHLTINVQGVRASRAYDEEPPPGRIRALCAGDAFTLGIGVDDASTWCARLAQLEPRLETVNLGQGGYGLDQSYLWVRRDAAAFHPKLLVFAFVRDEFGRMESDHFHHYPKPKLKLTESGELEVRNVPVPDRGGRVPWLVRNLSLFEKLRIVALARPALRALRGPSDSDLTVSELAELSGGVFTALQRIADAQDATLVLLYLPTYSDYESPGELWRSRIAREARTRGIAFVDLVDELRAMPRSEVARMFEPLDVLGPRGADAPFSDAGHEWVAQALRRHLRELPALAQALGARTDASSRLPFVPLELEPPWPSPSTS